MTTEEMLAEISRLKSIEARAKEMARTVDGDPMTPQRAREIGVARYILTGQKH